jgi:hypothetical protein
MVDRYPSLVEAVIEFNRYYARYLHDTLKSKTTLLNNFDFKKTCPMRSPNVREKLRLQKATGNYLETLKLDDRIEFDANEDFYYCLIGN